MNKKGFTPILILLVVVGVLIIAGGIWYYEAYSNNSSSIPVSSGNLTTPTSTQNASTSLGQAFENQYLKITVLPGWTISQPKSVEGAVNIVKGNYILYINPVFLHASGIEGGRFSEVAGGMPSVDAVVTQQGLADGYSCSQSPTDTINVNANLALNNLYTDNSTPNSECNFPSDGSVAWFGSIFSGPGNGVDYAITLAYNTTNANALPKKGSQELTSVFSDVRTMLNTLVLKPSITITKIIPQSGPPGTMVTVYGSGFSSSDGTVMLFKNFPNNFMPNPTISSDGNSLTFQVPSSIDTISCGAGEIDVAENCVPIPAGHVDVNDCPQNSDGSTNFCDVPIPPGAYQILARTNNEINSNEETFTVTPTQLPVYISLMYPTNLVSPGNTITVRGTGFTATGNIITIGGAMINNISSPDGKTLTFQAPNPSGTSLYSGLHIYNATISNANGTSNSISFDFRN